MSQPSDIDVAMGRDWNFLRGRTRPDFSQGAKAVRLVDLFSGAGGLTLGVAEAARRLDIATDVVLAVDFEPAPVAVFRHNFPKANVPDPAGVETYFDGELGAALMEREREVVAMVGEIDWLHGGPPCQGHSDLNNHTRRSDPRNRFYERMARAAEVLRPRVVLIENVPPVRNDRGNVVRRASRALDDAGYAVADAVVSFGELGVPQRRRRHALLALRSLDADPMCVLQELGGIEPRDLRWAIGDLEDAERSPLDVPSRMTAANRVRVDRLFESDEYNLRNEFRPPCHQGNHSYVSMYGRLEWDEPAQTMTSGYGSMGQGRYVHPSLRRTLTPHEAARIQFFPDWFDFTAGGLETRRGQWATMIGNAVPPKLTMELGRLLLPHLTGDRAT